MANKSGCPLANSHRLRLVDNTSNIYRIYYTERTESFWANQNRQLFWSEVPTGVARVATLYEFARDSKYKADDDFLLS